jgi:hypothetical protein
MKGAEEVNKWYGGLWRWLLVSALAVGAIVVLATAGNGGGIGLWFLLALACPLMMLFMMGSMQHQPGADGSQRHMAGGEGPTLEGLTRDEQIRTLRTEMTRMNWRQESLSQELERLERERLADTTPTGGAR